MDDVTSERRFARAMTGFLAYTVGVIVFGAYVRATLSGDGCGDHWPTCHGSLVPLRASSKTWIEFSHRATSGLAWIAAAVFAWWARRVFPRRHSARRGASWVLILMTTEAMIGAAIVLLKMVAQNESIARGYWISAHLLNTFGLLAAQTYTIARALSSPGLPSRRSNAPDAVSLATVCVGAGLLLVSVSGAIAALGDTLFPVDSLERGLAQDLSTQSHIFIRLRIAHPLIAMVVSVVSVVFGGWMNLALLDRRGRYLARVFVACVVVQVAVGVLNLTLLAPIWLQMIHLLIADMVWISFVLLSAHARLRLHVAFGPGFGSGSVRGRPSHR